MPTYYEVLNVQPDVATVEIEHAIEEQYNRWRRLVTHHDPAIASQATQALQALETIRTTLTDQNRRSAYDAGIGLSNIVSGLVDPATLLPGSVEVPPSSSPQGNKGMLPPPKLWVCYKCDAENSPQTKYCLNCGSQLVRKCPECQADASHVASGICGNCGYRFEIANRRALLRQEIASHEQDLFTLRKELHALDEDDHEGETGDGTNTKYPPLNPLGAFIALTAIGIVVMFNAFFQSAVMPNIFIGAVFVLLACAAYLPMKKQYEREVQAITEQAAQTESKRTHVSQQIAHLEHQVQQHKAELEVTVLT